jgi:DICT domain-containing protein
MNAGASMLDLSGVDGGGWVEGMMSDDVSEAAVSLPVQYIQKITPWF